MVRRTKPSVTAGVTINDPIEPGAARQMLGRIDTKRLHKDVDIDYRSITWSDKRYLWEQFETAFPEIRKILRTCQSSIRLEVGELRPFDAKHPFKILAHYCMI